LSFFGYRGKVWRATRRSNKRRFANVVYLILE